MAEGDQSLSLAEKILGDYPQPDIPELNAVSQFLQLDTCNNSQSHFTNLAQISGRPRRIAGN